MQKTPVIGQVLVVLSFVACGGDDSSEPVVPEFAGPPPLVAAPEAPPAAAESPSVDEDLLGDTGDDDAAGSGGVQEGMGLEPPLAPPAAEAPAAAEPTPMAAPEPTPMVPADPIAEAGGVPRPAGNLSTGFFVSDGRLYDRLGGVYSIATVVDDFIERIMIDPRLNANPKVDEAHHRVPPAGFKYLVTEMVCWATGGPQKYTGRSMKESHQQLMITAAEWEAFLDDLRQTLEKFAVPQAEQAEIKAVVASTRADIVV